MVARGLLHNPGLFDERRLGDPEVLTGEKLLNLTNALKEFFRMD